MTAQMTLPGLVPQWTLGDRLRKAREVAGLNQSEMSQQIGIARNSVANYESGRYDPPRPVMIARAFRTGISLDWLTTGTDEATEPPTPIRSTPIPGNLVDEQHARGLTRAEFHALRRHIPLRPPVREPNMRAAVAL